MGSNHKKEQGKFYMQSTVEILFGLFGGLAIFIFGMNMMSECLQ